MCNVFISLSQCYLISGVVNSWSLLWQAFQFITVTFKHRDVVWDITIAREEGESAFILQMAFHGGAATALCYITDRINCVTETCGWSSILPYTSNEKRGCPPTVPPTRSDIKDCDVVLRRICLVKGCIQPCFLSLLLWSMRIDLFSFLRVASDV